MRKTIIAVAAAVALGTATMATGAMAAAPHPHPHPHWGGGWGHRGFWGPGIGLYGFAPEYYGESCYQWQRVMTPHGWRLRRVWVCE